MRKLLFATALAGLMLAARSGHCDSMQAGAQKAPPAINKAEYCPDPEGCEPGPGGFTCTDSDGGSRTLVTGTVSLYYYGSWVASYTDYCSSNEWLVEHWCTSSGGWSTTNYLCLNGCVSGHCLP